MIRKIAAGFLFAILMGAGASASASYIRLSLAKDPLGIANIQLTVDIQSIADWGPMNNPPIVGGSFSPGSAVVVVDQSLPMVGSGFDETFYLIAPGQPGTPGSAVVRDTLRIRFPGDQADPLFNLGEFTLITDPGNGSPGPIPVGTAIDHIIVETRETVFGGDPMQPGGIDVYVPALGLMSIRILNDVPEPASSALFGSALIGLAAVRRRSGRRGDVARSVA